MSVPHLRYRAVFVSDFHLGSLSCRAEAITSFLRIVECEKLYLVGDIIDLWVSQKKGAWRQTHTEVLQTILVKSKEGTHIFMTPGNHDEAFRRFNGVDFEGILIDHQFVHETADGRRLLVVHGDLFDKSVTRFRAFAVLGAWIHEGLTRLNEFMNRRRLKKGLPPLGFADAIKLKVKRFISYKTNFPDRIVVDAKWQGFDGVVCGHVHRPEVVIHECGATYFNAGDWMKHCSALVEHEDGRIELVYWDDLATRLGLEAGSRGLSGVLG